MTEQQKGDIFNNQDNKGRSVGGPVHGGFVVQGDYHAYSHEIRQASPTSPTAPTPEELETMLETIQRSLRRIYSKSYRSVIQFSAPFFFDVEDKWVNLTLKLENDSTDADDYAALLKTTFAKADMLIIEGDPGVGKSSFMQRLAYEWSQSRLSDYDLVLYIEFRKLREHKFKDIEELITHYMKSYLGEDDYEILCKFIYDTKLCKEHKILVLLDGYDESSLEKQCQELSDYLNSTISRPLRFNVLVTSRKGYLSKLRCQGRFIFADIMGFTTESQRQEYISKHFNGTKSSENTAVVTTLLNKNANLKRLSETPLMMTFICLLHKKIVDGTELELYMNIIWWMIDRYQKRDPNQDVARLLGFEHNESDKFRVIQNNYQHFPQLHSLGKMAMQDIFKSTFTETDLEKFQLNEIVQVGLLRKEETTDDSYRMKTEFSFVHRTVQEFIMALAFFFSSDDPPEDFKWHVFYSGTKKGYGIISAKIQNFLDMIHSSNTNINEFKKTLYTILMTRSKQIYLNRHPPLKHTCKRNKNSQYSAIHPSREPSVPQSSEEALQLLLREAERGDTFAQCSLGRMYDFGIITAQSDEEAVKWYRKSADQGHAVAQLNLGVMYANGRGVPQSDEEAVKWYRKSAEQGDAYAQFNLGVMYDNGRGVSQSDEEAVKWYRKSADQGHAVAQLNLGVMYDNGRGVPQSDEEAIKWYRKSADQGHAVAQYNLGDMHYNGRGVTQSDEEAVKWFTKSAAQGDADAQYNLGDMYYNGRGVPQSDEEAVKWYRKSADQGDADAQLNLGLMYDNGRGVPQSDEEAIKWYRKSAEQGHASAQYNLGDMHYNGRGVPQSDEEAIKWYRKSAEQGHASAQYNLGDMHYNGRGVPQSCEEAVKWYRKAAEQGKANAQCSLGWMYQNGNGVSQSDGNAINWYMKAAEQEESYAQYNLGFMYLNGRGVPQSVEEAVKWYTKAAEHGHVDAQVILGFMNLIGLGVPQSDEEAIKWYTKAAEQGDANALFNLKFISDCGRGVSRANRNAVKWFTKAAEQGNADAQNNLGWMHYIGLSGFQSDIDAVKWFRKAAEQGNSAGQNNLGNMYENGRGVSQSAEEAVKWYTKSAEQGNAKAHSNCIEMSNEGQDISYYFWKIGSFLVPVLLVSLSWIIMKQRYR